MKAKIYIFTLLLFCLACSQPNRLELALEAAGENRAELEKVLTHFQHDKLKLKAAKFLITNMPYHFSYDEFFLSPTGRRYRPDITLIGGRGAVENYSDSLLQRGYRIAGDRLPDITTVNSAFLINNIELAFKVWQKPWARDVPFMDFCRFILPYRAQNELLSHLRREIMERFVPLLEAANATTSLEAAKVINEYLRVNRIVRYGYTGLPFYPTIEETYRSGISQCEGLTDLGVFIMRAVGIPVAVDLTIWTKIDFGHTWAVVLDNGVFHAFEVAGAQPTEYANVLADTWFRMPAKVYRRHFEPVDFSRLKNDDGFVLDFKSPLFEDVTNEYLTPTTTIRIAVGKQEDRQQSDQIYLTVHNFHRWKPIAVGRRSRGIGVFENVVGDNVFMVADSPNGRTLRFITPPFHVSKEGEIHKLIPQLQDRQEFTIPKHRLRRRIPHTLFYWDIYYRHFLPLPYVSKTDSTRTYDQIPRNALLLFSMPHRCINQRVFFIQNDSIRRY